MKIKIEFELELPDLPHTELELENYLNHTYNNNYKIEHANVFKNLKPCSVANSLTWDYVEIDKSNILPF